MSCKYSTPFQSVNNKMVRKNEMHIIERSKSINHFNQHDTSHLFKKRWHLRLTDALINLIVEVDNDIISAISYCL